MTKGTHLLRSALLALLGLVVISGASLASGDLFDKVDDYKDCPYQTRLRDGQIADLAVARDSDDADHVNVSWTATDAVGWGLGPNAYTTDLVVILYDGTYNTEKLSLGTRKVTFEGIGTGKKVKVQMAIVVDHADGDYLISDILEQSINQSLSEPVFMADVMQVTTAAVADDPNTTDQDETVAEVTAKTKGTMYYVGYNENFGNYKATGLNTMPSTARFRIGLAHSANETDAQRDDVDFDAYIIRITDEDGNPVSSGDDVATMKSSYATGRNRLVFGTIEQDGTLVGPFTAAGSKNLFSNVRINDGGTVRASAQDGGPAPDPFQTDGTTSVTFTPAAITANLGLSYVRPATGAAVRTVFAPLPNHHRDFPVDVLSSDETYTFEAWAIDEDRVVISPVASLKVRPIDEASNVTSISDYVGASVTDLTATTASGGLTNVTVTEFTVLK